MYIMLTDILYFHSIFIFSLSLIKYGFRCVFEVCIFHYLVHITCAFLLFFFFFLVSSCIVYFTLLLLFSHLADAFIQSDLQIRKSN